MFQLPPSSVMSCRSLFSLKINGLNRRLNTERYVGSESLFKTLKVSLLVYSHKNEMSTTSYTGNFVLYPLMCVSSDEILNILEDFHLRSNGGFYHKVWIWNLTMCKLVDSLCFCKLFKDYDDLT